MSETTDLSGVYDHTIFSNEESGWTVGVLEVEGRRSGVTVVGPFTASPGETLRLKGEWINNKKFGEQFQVTHFEAAAPATLDGLRKYLSSGMIKGIGPAYAERLIKRFGLEVPRVIEETPRRLREITGIGPARSKQIIEGWNAQKEIKNIMLFLQSHGVGTAHAVKIYKRYAAEAIEKVTENPYRLATDIHGIGFKTADQIAQKLGVEKNSKERIEAGLVYVLNEISDREGHVCYPFEGLLRRTARLLEIEESGITTILVEMAKPFLAPVVIEADSSGGRLVYSRRYYEAENESVALLKHLSDTVIEAPRPVQWEKFFEWYTASFDVVFSPTQQTAVRTVYDNKVVVVTGGPGTGKSTLIQAITTLYQKVSKPCLLAAPTGRAAQRMTEITGVEAKTLHRLLEFEPKTWSFKRDRENPLDCDLLIVDETSMVDLLLFQKLLRALPPTSQLLLVGDVDQLPSVGAGNVLRDLMGSGRFPVVRLTEIFRQAAHSQIIKSAHAINQGEFSLDRVKGAEGRPENDLFFIEREDPEACVAMISELCGVRIPKRFGFRPLQDVQVLVPMNRGIVGTMNLNQVLQQTLNPQSARIERGARKFGVGDRVIQTRNNYDLEVFNGDIGFVEEIDFEERNCLVRFESRSVLYDASDLDELDLAFAITIHKSQGSEFPAVIIPIMGQHTVMLQRNLLYTAVTRGRRLVVLVGARSAIGRAVLNSKIDDRHSRMRFRLSGEL